MTHPIDAPPHMVEKFSKGLPALKWWVDPRWLMEDVDYANKIALVLVVHHPATHGAMRAGEVVVRHTQDLSGPACDLILRANELAP